MRLIRNSEPLLVSVVLAASLSGCGGGNSSEPAATPPLSSFVLTSAVNSGVGTIEPITVTVTAGATVEFKLLPATGYILSSVSGCNGALSDNYYRVSNVNSDCVVSANFSLILNTYTITTSVNKGGSITPSSKSVLEGSSVTFDVELQSGYLVADIQGCNGKLNGNKYQVTSVNANCLITAIFADERRAPTQLAYKLNGDNAEITWIGNSEQGYKIYLSDQPFDDPKASNLDLTIINTKTTTSSIELYKSYNHLFARIAALYDNTEVLSTEQLEIFKNYQPKGSINDTGITYCLNDRTQASDCVMTLTNRQDGNIGRDAAALANVLIKTGLGSAGFDFSKIDITGKLLANQTAHWNDNGSESDGTQWSCARDNFTGLVWEIKAANGIRAKTNQFSWYHETTTLNGGNPGSENFDNCQQTACNTTEYIKFLNKIKYCGSEKWRLPSRAELLSVVVNHGATPRLDPLIFPDLSDNTTYWSSNSYMPDINNSWAVTTNNGIVVWFPKSMPLNVRLVHSN